MYACVCVFKEENILINSQNLKFPFGNLKSKGRNTIKFNGQRKCDCVGTLNTCEGNTNFLSINVT